MKIEQQRKLVYYLFAPAMVVMLASTWITWKYPEYSNYVTAAIGVFIVLLIALAIFMVRSKAT